MEHSKSGGAAAPHSPTLSATYVYREQYNLARQVLLQYGNYMVCIQPYKYIYNA